MLTYHYCSMLKYNFSKLDSKNLYNMKNITYNIIVNKILEVSIWDNLNLTKME